MKLQQAPGIFSIYSFFPPFNGVEKLGFVGTLKAAWGVVKECSKGRGSTVSRRTSSICKFSDLSSPTFRTLHSAPGPGDQRKAGRRCAAALGFQSELERFGRSERL